MQFVKVLIDFRSVGREDSVVAGDFEGEVYILVFMVFQLLVRSACDDFLMSVGDEVDANLQLGFVGGGPRKLRSATIFFLF